MLCGTASTRSRANRRGIGTRRETIADSIHLFPFEKEGDKEKRRKEANKESFHLVVHLVVGGEKGRESWKFTKRGAVPSIYVILSQRNHLPITLEGQCSSMRTMTCQILAGGLSFSSNL